METLEHFSFIAAIVKSRLQQFKTIAVVVSAMRGTTDQLISYAHAVNPNPPRREYDMLITVGERMSCSLLAMALERIGIPALSFTGSQAGIITTDEHAEAKIIDVKPHRLYPHIQNGKVIIVAGFQGVSQGGSITSLGRGGSDTTAVALSAALKASCVEFYKDVSGIYSSDPKKDSSAMHIPVLTYVEALKLIEQTGNILHPRSISLAERNRIPLHISSFHHWNNPQALYTIIRGEEAMLDIPVYEQCGNYA